MQAMAWAPANRATFVTHTAQWPMPVSPATVEHSTSSTDQPLVHCGGAMTTTQTAVENPRNGGQPAMQTPPIVSPEAWNAAREQMLIKEKAHTHARDALAAERRRMPWMAVEKSYAFEGP